MATKDDLFLYLELSKVSFNGLIMQLENFFEIAVSISCLKMSTLLQNDQMNYFHHLSKLGPGLKYYKAKQLKLSWIFIYLRPSKWPIFCILHQIY